MKTKIVKIGSSRVLLIPKTIFEQLKFEEMVEFEILPEGILLRPVLSPDRSDVPRADWSEIFQMALIEEGDDAEQFADWNVSDLSVFEREEW